MKPSIETEYPIEPELWGLYPPTKTGMHSNVDLTGMRFHRWTVLAPEEYHKGSGWYWHCRCDCGTEKAVSQRFLLDGKSKSCGCYRKTNIERIHSTRKKGQHKKARVDLSGERFGRWTVLRKAEHEVGKHPKWLCQCDCGTIKVISHVSLKSGQSQSCGCMRQDMQMRRYYFGEFYPDNAEDKWKNHIKKEP